MDNYAHPYAFQLSPTQLFNLKIYILGAFGPFYMQVRPFQVLSMFRITLPARFWADF